MSKKKKENGLVPALRFPEFRDKGEWKSELFGEIYNFKTTNSLSRDKLNYEKGTVKNIHYGDIHTKFSTLFDIENEVVPYINPTESLEKIKPESFCVEGDMIFADASEDMDDIGKCIEIVSLNNEKLVSGLHTLLARQINKKLIVGFGGYLFKSSRIREQIRKESQGAKVLGLSGGRLSSITVVYPADEKEQQKIADCLASIDDLVAFETQKLDGLKAHKKGLMQQLFPAEGETLPKLRFPEFRGKGEWEETTLGQCLVRRPEYGINAPSVPFAENLPTYLRITDISDDGRIRQDQRVSVAKNVTDENYLEDGDIVLARTGASVGKAYKYRINDGRLVFAGFLIRVRADEQKLNSEFLFHFLSTEQYWRWVDFSSARSGQPGINGNEYASLPLQLPPTLKEQQKIADCLASIGELIAVQTQKIEVFKAHKKGLMQQLFPGAGTE